MRQDLREGVEDVVAAGGGGVVGVDGVGGDPLCVIGGVVVGQVDGIDGTAGDGGGCIREPDGQFVADWMPPAGMVNLAKKLRMPPLEATLRTSPKSASSATTLPPLRSTSMKGRW